MRQCINENIYRLYKENSDITSTNTAVAAKANKSDLQAVADRANKYLMDYGTSSKIYFAVSGGKLIVSINGGAWRGQVALTQIVE